MPLSTTHHDGDDDAHTLFSLQTSSARPSASLYHTRSPPDVYTRETGAISMKFQPTE